VQHACRLGKITFAYLTLSFIYFFHLRSQSMVPFKSPTTTTSTMDSTFTLTKSAPEVSSTSNAVTSNCGLALPAELRLTVYAYLPQLIYQPLPGLNSHSSIYWPHYTLPPGAILTSWQLRSELKAALADYDQHDEPDVLLRLPYDTHLSELVHFIVMTTKSDAMLVDGNEKQYYWKESLK